nr:DUF4258 domain-containing protein [Nitrospirota bacterium]
MEIDWIRESIRQGRFIVSFTHTEKLRRRQIGIQEIEDVAHSGTIIEEYLADPRGPSCLLLGQTKAGRAIHVVCGKTRGRAPDRDSLRA